MNWMVDKLVDTCHFMLGLVRMGVSHFFVFRHGPQSAILHSMRLALMASMLVMSLALNAETIQGRVVRVVESRPFNKLEAHRIVVKNVNHFGDEMMRLFRVPVNK